MRYNGNELNLKEAFEKFLSKTNNQKKFKEVSVVALWPEVIGSSVANRTKKIYIYDRKLFVKIESSVVKNELLMVRAGIIQKLNERAGASVIDEMVFL